MTLLTGRSPSRPNWGGRFRFRGRPPLLFPRFNSIIRQLPWPFLRRFETRFACSWEGCGGFVEVTRPPFFLP